MDPEPFQEMRASREETDLIVQIGGKEMHLHRIIMMARCPYFRGLYDGLA